eukprot:GILK01002957.1.p1 GENE.GILK01002957.1~~GILK01002957.1.p1  ORF type:complete len:103 (-),score=12.12 GILK01002957.1:293-601(-)
MSLRVLTERLVVSGHERAVTNLLRKLQSKALSAPGFISSEPLRDLNEPHKMLVMSSWQSVEAWKKWSQNQERKVIAEEIEKHLSNPTMHRVMQPPRHDVFLL